MGVIGGTDEATPTSTQLKDRTVFIVEEDTKYWRHPGGAVK